MFLVCHRRVSWGQPYRGMIFLTTGGELMYFPSASGSVAIIAAHTIPITIFSRTTSGRWITKLKHMTQFMLNRWIEISSTTDAENGNAERFGMFNI